MSHNALIKYTQKSICDRDTAGLYKTSPCRIFAAVHSRYCGHFSPKTTRKNNNMTLQWRHNERDGVWNHRRLHCLPSRLFRCWSMKTSKLHINGLCEGNPPVTGGFPSQRVCNAENVSILLRHHESSVRMIYRCLTWVQNLTKVLTFSGLHRVQYHDIIIAKYWECMILNTIILVLMISLSILLWLEICLSWSHGNYRQSMFYS